MSIRRRNIKHRVARANAFHTGIDEFKLSLAHLQTAVAEAKVAGFTHITAEWLANKLGEVKARS